MAGLALLKRTFNRSNEALCERCYQLLCDEAFFRHDVPFDRSSMTRWLQRMGEDKIIALLQESLNVATRVGAAKPSDFSSFIVDTTVQPKAVELPTHASRPREAGAVGQKAGEPRDYFRKAGADAGKVALRGQGTSR
jgi:IS5 family transposase